MSLAIKMAHHKNIQMHTYVYIHTHLDIRTNIDLSLFDCSTDNWKRGKMDVQVDKL